MIKETETNKKPIKPNKPMTTFSMKHGLRIGTWNVRTLLGTSRLAQLCKSFSDYGLLLLGVSEVRWPDAGEFSAPNGLKFIFSGRANGQKRESGVGFLISKQAQRALLEWKAHTDRIISARFLTRVRKVTVIQCYAPTEVSERAQKDEFYDSLTGVLRNVNRGDIVILMGDFNAQVGGNNIGLESTMGRQGIGQMTENGELFTGFCRNQDLVIGGTLFPHKRIHKVTWVSPDNATENQIDHIAISRKWRGSLLDVRNRRGADIASDHHLLSASIRLKIASIKRNRDAPQRKFDVSKLSDPAIREQFLNAIRESAGHDRGYGGWPNVRDTILKAAEEHIGYKVMRKKPWISENTWNLINSRSLLKNKFNAAKTRAAKASMRNDYTKLDKLVKKGARKDKRQWSQQISSDAQAAADTHRSRDMFRLIRQLTNTSFPTTKPLMNADGVLTTSKEEQIRIWEEYYKELLSATDRATESLCSCTHHMEYEHLNITCPDLSEIASAIDSLKANKAPGPDNIQPELLKADRMVSAQLLYPLIERFWSDEVLPPQLTEGIITLLPKKGNLTECKNWRGITLLSMVNKIIAHIINKRLSDYISPRLRNEQAGFRAHRSCVDHVNTLRIIVEQSVEWRTPLYLCFIDFAKAFDTIDQGEILKILECRGVPRKLINLIRALYNDASCRVRHEQQLSGRIRVQKGVRQGCVLSPLLFNIVLDTVMLRVAQGNRGISWGLQGNLCDLDYADDICLLSHKYSNLMSMLDDVRRLAATVGLSINISKTKVMRINTTNSQPIKIGEESIETVNSFCYLGSVITTNGGSADDIICRINKGRAAFYSLDKVWRSTHISRNTKIRLFNACIKSVVLYGCETWNAPTRELNMLQAFINRCLRIILRVFWPNTISNESLWRDTGQDAIINEIKRRKWKWIGHTLRKPYDDITRTSLDWNPQGSRRRGRPSNTWRRKVAAEVADAGYTWNEIKTLAMNRPDWNEFVEALSSS